MRRICLHCTIASGQPVPVALDDVDDHLETYPTHWIVLLLVEIMGAEG